MGINIIEKNGFAVMNWTVFGKKKFRWIFRVGERGKREK